MEGERHFVTSVEIVDSGRGSKRNHAVSFKFANGVLSYDKDRNTYENELKFGRYHNRNDKDKKTLVAETSDAQFTGTSDDPILKKSMSPFCEMVGVFNKKTGKLMILQADKFLLHPNFPNSLQSKKESKPDEEDTRTLKEKQDLLSAAFGSKRTQQNIQMRIANKLSTDCIKEEVVSEAMEQMKERDKIRATLPSLDNSGTIPPINKAATDPVDVYDFHDIVPKNVYTALKSVAQPFLDADRKQILEWKQNQLSVLVSELVLQLPTNSKERNKKARLLIFMHYLVNLYNMKVADLKKTHIFPEDVPPAASKLLVANYTVTTELGKKRITSLPARLKDKLVAHILVLSLICSCSFTVELFHLLQDVNVGRDRLFKIVEGMGCRLQESSDHDKSKVAVLKIPLQFKDNKKGFTQRRR